MDHDAKDRIVLEVELRRLQSIQAGGTISRDFFGKLVDLHAGAANLLRIFLKR